MKDQIMRLGLFIASLACVTLVALPAVAQAPAVAKEASDFFDRAEGCVHFGGEVPENPRTRAEKQRAADVAKKMKELCTGNKKRIAALRIKFKADKLAMEKITEAENLLEESGALQ